MLSSLSKGFAQQRPQTDIQTDTLITHSEEGEITEAEGQDKNEMAGQGTSVTDRPNENHQT